MSTAPTWAELGVEEMRRGLILMRQSCPYFAWQLPDGSYRPCRQIGQLTQFEGGIFNGTHTPGFYAIRPDNFTRWGAIDFDNHDGSKSRKYWLPDAERALDYLASQLAELWLVESSPGGYHVIGFADALLPAGDMRRILLEIAPAGVEAFPKQDALDTTKPNAKGSLLRFPGYHQLKGTWARLTARSGLVPDADGVAPVPILKLWQEPTSGSQLLSLYAQVTRGLPLTGNGQRFNAMQTIVGRLKGRTLDEAIAVEIHDRFYNQHRALIQTPIHQSRAHFLTWFRKAAPCCVELPDYLTTATEEAKIAALPPVPDVPHDRLAATVRLFLSAKKHSDKTGKEFCLSLRLISQRLGVSIASASSYAAACRKAGIVVRLKIGSDYTGMASTYQPGREWPS
jgi:hypothetical protein